MDLIIEYANLDAQNDIVLEIGAGLGTLSDYLIEHSKKLFLIENDKKIGQFLYSEYSKKYNCQLVNLLENDNIDEIEINLIQAKVIVILGDALKIPFPKVNRIVSNIPYQISAPLLFKIIDEWNYDQVNLMVQAEFADRLIAPVNSKNYSRLAASVGLFLEVEENHLVSPQSFFPPPQVFSKLITITQKTGDFDSKLRWEYRKKYLTLLQAIFPFKNKNLRKALKLGLKNNPEIENFAPSLTKIVHTPEKFSFSQSKLRSLSSTELFEILLYGITGKTNYS